MEQQQGERCLWLLEEENLLAVQFHCQLPHATFWTSFFVCTDVQRVRLRPVFCLDEDLVDRIVGVAGFEEVCASGLKIGSPSSSKRFAVLMSQAGYLRVGLTLAAKFASVSRRALSGVARRAWK